LTILRETDLLSIRSETPEDREAIYHINEAAFGQKKEPELVEKLRNRDALIISLVAVSDGQTVGNITFSAVTVKSESSDFQAISLSTMAVLPEYQRRGIGSQLVKAGLEECRLIGQEIVVVVGHPEYYPRFGFVQARTKGLDCEFKVPDEAWMLCELRDGALAVRRGTVFYQPEFREAL
jgi:putative acetyltransferase